MQVREYSYRAQRMGTSGPHLLLWRARRERWSDQAAGRTIGPPAQSILPVAPPLPTLAAPPALQTALVMRREMRMQRKIEST
jgi:hypothetical protein